ncbi:hypothetical protein LX36DRAFT_109642 [Colletotrichum falcatum]|nr:hypothetical protein LX36DRAFT_109642 [Colletotrichum falcatum]
MVGQGLYYFGWPALTRRGIRSGSWTLRRTCLKQLQVLLRFVDAPDYCGRGPNLAHSTMTRPSSINTVRSSSVQHSSTRNSQPAAQCSDAVNEMVAAIDNHLLASPVLREMAMMLLRRGLWAIGGSCFQPDSWLLPSRTMGQSDSTELGRPLSLVHFRTR